MDNKQLKKLAVVSAITLFSSTILSSTNFQNGKLQLGTPVVLAEDPPVDEDVPLGPEMQLIQEARQMLDDVRLMLGEGESEVAKEMFEEFEHDKYEALKAIPKLEVKAPGLLAEIESLRAELYGTTPAPTPQPQPTITKETEVFPVGTIYSEDPNAEANTQTVISEGTPGEITYIVTDGVRDQGTETIPMVPRRVSVGTKPTVVTEEIPAPADIEEKDSELEEGQRVLKSAGTKGSRTTTTTYSLDLTTGEAVANTPTVEETPGTAAVYRVGTKKVAQPPVVTTRTEVIPVTTVYTEDPTKEANSQEVTFEGSVGERTYTTTDGVEDDGVVTKVMQPKQVTVGTKPTVVTEVLPAPADVEEPDFNLEEGKRELKTPGVDGSRTTTTTYSLDPATGLVTANEPVVEETPGTAAVYRVGLKKLTPISVPEIKEETETETIGFTTEKRENPDLPKGETRVIQAGKDGARTITYRVITVDGIETSRVVVSDEPVAPVAEIIEVGTKAVSSSDETTNQSSTNVATTTNPIVTSQLTKVIKTTIVKKELPKTGEQQSMLTMVGIALLGMVTAIFTLGKKKPKN